MKIKIYKFGSSRNLDVVYFVNIYFSSEYLLNNTLFCLDVLNSFNIARYVKIIILNLRWKTYVFFSYIHIHFYTYFNQAHISWYKSMQSSNTIVPKIYMAHVSLKELQVLRIHTSHFLFYLWESTRRKRLMGVNNDILL